MKRSNLDDYFNSYMNAPASKFGGNRAFNSGEYLREGLSEKDLQKLKETFDLFDIDKSGFISPIKLRAAFKTYANLSVTKETIYHLICEFDNDENGELTFSDFVKLASPLYAQVSIRDNELKKIFQLFDKEGKGFLTVKDLESMGTEFTDIFGKDGSEAIVMNCSSDGNKITMEDFCRTMNYQLV